MKDTDPHGPGGGGGEGAKASSAPIRRAVFSVLVYSGLALLPLGLAAIGAPAPRGFWIEFGVGLGFVALAMFGLQFALTARFRQFAGYFGQDTMLQFHRQAAMVAFAFVLGHVFILLSAHRPFAAFLDLRVNFLRAAALWGVLALLPMIIVMTIWRVKLRIPYEWWRLGHGIMAIFIVLVGMVHVLRVNHYVSAPWKQAFWAMMTGGAMLLLLHVRVLKPLRLLRRPYRVVEVRREAEACWTVVLEPDGHAGIGFKPGQFAWLTIGVSPFALEQHPFSFSSSAARPQRLEFTVKELGDYTARIGEVKTGTTAYLEGPYGAFTLDDSSGVAAEGGGGVFIVGGIGITPIMSILRTLRDKRDVREHVLIYANIAEERIVFRRELDEIAGALNLKIVHVLEQPTAEWKGERGRITPELLDDHLPSRSGGSGEAQRQYLVCGPDPLMDLVEQDLIRRGVPLTSIRSERFNIA